MKELGEYLKKAREARNISLKDIQDSTKIRLAYLEAIERGDFSGLPGEVYCKGFLTSFASAVGLDPQEVLKRYHQLKGGPEAQPILVDPPTSAPPSQPVKALEPEARPREKKRKLRKGRMAIVGVAILIILAVIGFLLARNISWERMPSKVVVSTKTKIKKNHIKQLIKSTPQVTPVVSSVPTATNEPAATGTVTKQLFPAPVTIYASFVEPVWVRVTKDGELSEDGRTFTPSDAQQLWTAQRELEVTIGNAAGIKLQVNGKDQGVLGEHNKVLKLKITPDGNITQLTINPNQ